ncbi:AAA family ATPase [Candidatus Nardonella dryophthoridicola]|uniref:AAA family ATPase n=1 Tax=Candidatus Nardonella dryophthoridicola TaxID=1971485 RepID=UPI003B9786F9
MLCLIGPPGVGKTSLCKSIANATKRKYIKISLNGMKDESEIRGHRKTYIGSMPGKIIQNIIKSNVKNPLLLLDEIDKISYEYNKNNISSSLLDILDPDHNNNFVDNYIEIEYDLSEIMFIATANNIDNIPLPLLDRMEIINITGYTEKDKINILKNHLIKKKINENLLKNNEISISNNVLIEIIRYYTKEHGVRNLEKEISKICRKSVKKIDIDNIKKINININNLKKFLGPRKFNHNIYEIKKSGTALGLA